MQKQGEVLEGEAGSYRLIERVGHGGFGTTYRAERLRDADVVAVKELRFDRIEDWKAVELFDREAQTLAALDHPSIPEYVDNFVLKYEGGPPRFILVQEFVEGPTLDRVVAESRELDAGDMESWFRQILEVCDYLHGLSPPVIHRDIAPKNIVLRDDGTAFLIDFGTVQARVLEEGDMGSTSAGTFGYAAMEQFVGRAVPASDLYSLAMTYLAVRSGTGPEKMPFDGNRVDVEATLRASPVDRRLRTLLDRMTEPDPRARPQSAREVLDALDGAPAAESSAITTAVGGALNLEIESGPGAGRRLSFDGDIVKIGRADSCHLHLDHPSLSRMHAVIERGGNGSYTVIDLGSSNGTRVNGQRVNKQPIRSGDRIEVGDVALRVQIGDVPASSQALVRQSPTAMQEVTPQRRRQMIVMATISLVLALAGVAFALMFMVA